MAGRPWGGVTHEISLGRVLREVPEICVEALVDEAQIELEAMRERAPLDTDPRPGDRGGELRASGRLEPVRRDRDGSLEVTIVFGSADVPYAVAQHQRHDHHVVGQRLYATSVLDASKRLLRGRIGRRVAARLMERS